MPERFGFPLDKWNKAKDEMRQVLVNTAKKRGVVPYGELVSKVQTIKFKPESYALAGMLGELSKEEDQAGRGMISVLVVHKTGDYHPGPGFFGLAAELGRDTSDILECWVEELKRVHSYWSEK